MTKGLFVLAISVFCFAEAFSSVSQNAGKLLITEVAMKESNDGDWLELFVVDGSIDWSEYRIYSNASSYFKLPSNPYQTGQYIVLHEDTTGTDGLVGNCWHFYGALGTGLRGTDQNIFITDPGKASTYVDAVIYSNNSGEYTGSKNKANDIVEDGMWDSYDFSTGDAGAWTDTDDVSSNQSLCRYMNAGSSGYVDNNSKSDWYCSSSQSPGSENDSSVPVSLSSFAATPQENSIVLTWTTESEFNTLGFKILRSLEPEKGFVAISSLVRAAGNSLTTRHYRFVDQNVQPGVTYYYCLKEIDFDGKIKLHSVVSARIDENNLNGLAVPNQVQLSSGYPNPFGPGVKKPEVKFRLFLPAGKQHWSEDLRVKITDILGREVTHWQVNFSYSKEQMFFWNGRDMFGNFVPAGVYFFQVQGSSFDKVQKILFVR
ncbi:MAG TPA: hypothetical protein ENF45_02830 [Bacteroidetes bacterium]|nr:hypothetical protein [Bacteroidota bacterium]